MKLAITASRHWKNKQQIWDELDKIHALTPIQCLIHGDAIGGDRFCKEWAIERKIIHVPVRPVTLNIATDYFERNEVIVRIR
jgi:hypothetical protein